MDIGHRRIPFVLLLSFLLIIGLSSAQAQETFFDTHGISLFYGHSDYTNIGPSPADDYEWTSVNYVLGKRLTPVFAIEGRIGGGYLNTENHGSTLTAEARLLLDVRYKFLFFKIGGGVAHLFDDDNLPGLAEYPVHGIISGSAGFRFSIEREEKPPVELTLGYGVEHMSAPFKGGEDGDDGWNVGGALLSLTWPI
jgi:hypothetical protein